MDLSKFRHNFWETEMSATNGFDRLVNGIKEGGKHSEEIAMFIRKRLAIEDQYAKELKKLSDHFQSQSKTGTMRRSWLQIVAETEKLSENHSQLARNLDDRRKQLDTYISEHKELQSNIKKKVRAAQEQKHSCFKAANTGKDNYHKLCKDSESAQNTFFTHKQANKDNADKLQQKWQKLQEDANRADSTYKGLLQKLEDSRLHWEKEMEHACDLYEEMESQRIVHLRNELWICCNLLVQTTLQDNKVMHRCLDSLEHCDPGSDIQQFIQQRKTGSVRPAELKYESFFAQGNQRLAGSGRPSH